MIRTIVLNRKKFSKQNIDVHIKKRNNTLCVEVLLHNLQQANYQDNAIIFLEAHDRTNIERWELGKVRNYKEKRRTFALPKEFSKREKINFRLKIIDPKSYAILGYAEKLKEKKYTDSMLQFTIGDDGVKNMYKIDFTDPDYPVLHLNSQLAPYENKLKPILAEMALKDILKYLLDVHGTDSIEDLRENKWFKFAEQYCTYDEYFREPDNQLDWIHAVLCKFAEKNKLIPLIKKELKVHD